MKYLKKKKSTVAQLKNRAIAAQFRAYATCRGTLKKIRVGKPQNKGHFSVTVMMYGVSILIYAFQEQGSAATRLVSFTITQSGFPRHGLIIA